MNKRPFRPKQSLGQNFLQDDNVVRKIVRHMDIHPQDTVVEIGPGFGVLTEHLLSAVPSLVAVELDGYLFEKLKSRFEEQNLKLIHGDFLKTDLRQFVPADGKLRVVGNIPYHITSPVIFKIFDERHYVRDLVLMIQREVAERIVAPPGNKSYGILSVFSQLYAEPKILFYVSRQVFNPKPDVESAVIRWDFERARQWDIHDEEMFRRVVRTSFQQRRKMLRRSLHPLFGSRATPEEIDFDLRKRPEQLTVAEFVELSNLMAKLWMKKI